MSERVTGLSSFSCISFSRERRLLKTTKRSRTGREASPGLFRVSPCRAHFLIRPAAALVRHEAAERNSWPSGQANQTQDRPSLIPAWTLLYLPCSLRTVR